MSKSAWYCQENSVLDSVGGTLEPIKHWFLLQLKTVLITVISELANTRIVFNNNEKLILGAKIQT